MDLEIKGKVALVFGAGGGLGGAIAEALAGEGVRVAMADVSEDGLARTRTRVAPLTVTVAVGWDIADHAATAGHLAEVERIWARSTSGCT